MAGEIRFNQPRDPEGQFRAMSAEVERQLHSQAQEFQDEVASYIGSHIKRPRDSTGRLANVTADSGNRTVAKTYWRVGIPGFLNRSQAKYWRTIEEGSLSTFRSGGFRGTPLKLSRGGAWPGGRPFRSFSRNENRNFRGGHADLQGTRTWKLVIVKNEIQPMNAYQNTWRQGNWEERVGRSFRQSVGKYF